MGEDETAFVIAELNGKMLKVVWCDVLKKTEMTEPFKRIIELDKLFNFRMMFVDDSGLGAGVTDFLIEKLFKYSNDLIQDKKEGIDKDLAREIKNIEQLLLVEPIQH